VKVDVDDVVGMFQATADRRFNVGGRRHLSSASLHLSSPRFVCPSSLPTVISRNSPDPSLSTHPRLQISPLPTSFSPRSLPDAALLSVAPPNLRPYGYEAHFNLDSAVFAAVHTFPSAILIDTRL
jgi:hypothetical protein